MKKMLLVVLSAVVGGLAFAQAESVDVLVVGGTEKGVRTAVAEAKAGKSVFLVTAYPYLGEDSAGTLELGFGKTCPTDPLGSRLWHEESGLAGFDYWPERKTDGLRWIYKNDWFYRLSEPRRPPSPSDSVWYNDDISYRCVLRKPSKISRIEIIALETDTVSNEGVSANFKGLDRNHAATGGATCRVTKGPLAGKTFEFRCAGKAFDVVGDYYGGRADAISFVADVDADLEEVELVVKRHPQAQRQLVSRIWFHLADPLASVAPPSPLKVKRVYDDELVKAGVRFLTTSPVRRVLRDAAGRIEGVEIANRSGRSEIRAKKVVDATRYGALGGFDLGGEAEFSRVVIAAGEPPSAPDMSVERLEGAFPSVHAKGDPVGRVYRCTFTLPMESGAYPAFAAAEWKARALTWAKGTMDDANLLTLRSPVKPAARSASDELPCWGEYDVVVVGGGTAGVPAAIAAGRAGAKVLLVEYRTVLGGTGTDGMITGYYDGNHCGFTEEFKAYNKTIGSRFSYYFRSESWRRLCDAAGVRVWLGAMGIGVRKDGNRVTGVEVGTALGSGFVKAKCVVDGTGNSDVAALAGAGTVFLSNREFALQSAGQAPQRIGSGGANSDFGFVNDSDAWDLWLFCLRARAGAPNAWDIAQMPDSRERRRIVADYCLNGQDVAAHRPFPDTVVQPRSRQDSHGYLTDDFRFVSETSEAPFLQEKGVPRYAFNVNLPLRSLLPRGLDGLAVVGLGAGVARDVVPIVRMQADLMNMGYSVGTAAAMAARKGGDFRAIDVNELRRKLVEKKILRAEALGWTEEADVGSDALLAASVKSMGVGCRGSHVVFRSENRARALPLLRDAYRSATTPEAKQIYAKTLGLLGDATGADTLVGVVTRREPIVVTGESSGAFGGGNRSMDGFLVALGRTRDPRALKPMLALLEAVTADQPVMALRGPTLGLEALASREAAPALAACLRKPGLHGFAVSDFRTLAPIGGYGLGPEMDNCIRELALARALWACGDHEGLAKKTLEAYAADPRGVLSAHAKAVLGGDFGR